MASSKTVNKEPRPKFMHICDTDELKTGSSRKCQIKGADIRLERPGLEKTRIHLKDLSNVVMQERNFTIDKHKYDFIICLQSDTDVVYLKADTKQEMEEWYQALLAPLINLGWIENDKTIIQRGVGLIRTCKSLKTRKAPRVVPRLDKSLSVAVTEGVFQNTDVREQTRDDTKEDDVSSQSSDGIQSRPTSIHSSASEWSSSSKSTDSSPTDNPSEPKFYHESSSMKAPVPCTDLKEHSKESVLVINPTEQINREDIDENYYVDNINRVDDVDTNHCELNAEDANQENHQYMALLNRGNALDPEYGNQIISTGRVARNRRPGRHNDYIMIESDHYQTPHPEPEVKLRHPRYVDGPCPLRSRENSVDDAVRSSHGYPPYSPLRSVPHSPQSEASISDGAAAMPLRSKENTPHNIREAPRGREYSGRCQQPNQTTDDGRSNREADVCAGERSRSPSNCRRSSPPRLPARDGITNRACFRRFVEKQRQADYVIVELHKSDLQAGKRLHIAKIIGSIWICSWESYGGIALEQQLHPGDELIKVNDIMVKGQDVKFVYTVLSSIDAKVRLTLRRAPHATAQIVHRTSTDQDLGIRVENNIIKSISASGDFGSSTNLKLKTTGVIKAGTLVDWAITEINWQPLSCYATTDEVETLLRKGRTDVALVVQPSDLVRAMMEESRLCSKCGSTSSPPSSPRCSNCNLSFKPML